MVRKKLQSIVEIPEGVEVSIKLPRVVVSGPLGKTEGTIKISGFSVKKEDNKIVLDCKAATKKQKKLMNTIASLIKNRIIGVIDGYEYQLQICSVHFPMNVKVDKEKGLVIIKNFLGENKDRLVKLIPGAEVEIKGDIILVKALEKDLAGQQAADIEKATKISGKDRRIFQDGIWIIKKEKGRSKHK